MNTADLNTPLFKLTVGEFLEMVDKKIKQETTTAQSLEPAESASDRYVYGLSGIAQLFGCSRTQAHRIKTSGKIDGALTQVGRLIIVEAEKALQLAGRQKKSK